ncbi:alpha/beta hydrolase [Spiractinospora alimapuensis]|uniref:alpha/beta fold hydrolase n=1 Tax=Spiractinospora alimapuensis TaxID=2820884 RepID=UPI001F203079|nr:alpha/beta hydrolase [Spiractinospora alimapuensis]QVQ52828.1 alpha/beta hydrolase [Spiractinospora alimapuensis]
MPSTTLLTLNDRRLAYEDYGPPTAPVVVALHGHFGRGRIFAPLAEHVSTSYRIVAPDQRGHGRSDNGGDFHPDAYVADLEALLTALALGPVVLLGHSMGGVVAYRLAARRPDLVRGLIVEDIGAVTDDTAVAHPVLDVTDWPTTAPSPDAMRAAIEERGIPDATYFLHSVEHDPDSATWRLLFDPADMMRSQKQAMGDHWDDWLASTCPALLMRGGHSTLLSADMAADMVRRRPNTKLVDFPDAGHWIHDDAPDAFAATVTEFLAGLSR